MLSGTEEIWYTPVEAYEVSTFADGIVSGGTGGDATISGGVRFTWVFDPSSPGGNPSGFTGRGWFEETEHSPIWYSVNYCGMTLEKILQDFATGERKNLNDVFANWQTYVNSQPNGKDIVAIFQSQFPYFTCWRNV